MADIKTLSWNIEENEISDIKERQWASECEPEYEKPISLRAFSNIKEIDLKPLKRANKAINPLNLN